MNRQKNEVLNSFESEWIQTSLVWSSRQFLDFRLSNLTATFITCSRVTSVGQKNLSGVALDSELMM